MAIETPVGASMLLCLCRVFGPTESGKLAGTR